MSQVAKEATDGRAPVRVLPPELADQIAAGEVVERPASAVKELVENALDAEATTIEVELEEGGLRLLRVVDDGTGMTRSDAELAIQRHATSKIRTREDLFRISTLGFRGEALPSIASVSRFSLVTKPRGAIGGTRIEVEGGKLLDVRDAGAAPGTVVTVRDLFYNTPARLKFLKTRATEVRHIVESIHRVAMCNPGTAFRVRHNGRSLVDLPAVERRRERLFSILGADEASALYPAAAAEQDGVRVSGFFAAPTLTRRTSAGIWTFVNGRYVRDKTVIAAIRVAYQGLIDRGRHPVVVLDIELSPDDFDVNVHPMKLEVRFERSDAVFRAVRRSLANAIAESPWLPDGAELPRRSGTDADPEESALSQGRLVGSAAAPRQPPPGVPVRTYRLGDRDGGRDGGSASSPRDSVAGPRVAAADSGDPAVYEEGYFSSLAYVGQIHRLYLLCQDAGGLVVVDQHAAHERITYEHLREAWREKRTAQQPLLVPSVLQLDSLRAATMEDHIDFFEQLGFEIEPFGGNDFALKAVPIILEGASHYALVRDTLDELAEHGSGSAIDDAVDAILIRMACHGSVRAGEDLTPEEARELFRQMDEIDFGANCPHGRPVYFRLSLDELEKRFGRR